MVRIFVDSFFMSLAFPAEWLRPGVEISQDAHNVLLFRSHVAEPRRQGIRVRRFLGAKAPVAAAIVGGTDRPTAVMGDRTKARRAVRHHHADRSPSLAFDTYTMSRGVRLFPPQKRSDYFDELPFVDRASPQLEIDADMIGNRRGRFERLDVCRMGVDDRDELFHMLEITQRLNSAGRGASADRDEIL